jgi:hypothetical protein
MHRSFGPALEASEAIVSLPLAESTSPESAVTLLALFEAVSRHRRQGKVRIITPWRNPYVGTPLICYLLYREISLMWLRPLIISEVL